ncbi:MAG: hypothetical protein M3386_04290, partial [Actinomycetota bacterium]|nr:hypothetical protein [Actinomycetota bacterium]
MGEPGDGTLTATIIGQGGQRHRRRDECTAVKNANTERARPVERRASIGWQAVEAQPLSPRLRRRVPQLGKVGTVLR